MKLVNSSESSTINFVDFFMPGQHLNLPAGTKSSSFVPNKAKIESLLQRSQDFKIVPESPVELELLSEINPLMSDMIYKHEDFKVIEPHIPIFDIPSRSLIPADFIEKTGQDGTEEA